MKIRPVGAELFHPDRQTDRPTGGHDELTVDLRNFASFLTSLKIASFLVANCKQSASSPRRTERRATFLLSFRKGPGSNTDQNSQGCQLWQFSCFLDPWRQRWNEGFYHTNCTFLSNYHCLNVRPQNAKMFVVDERVSLNKPEIKRKKWWNTYISGISGGRNNRK